MSTPGAQGIGGDPADLPFDPTEVDPEAVDRGYDPAFGCRVYSYRGYNLPSVTSVLSRLGEHPSGAGMSPLDEWRFDHDGEGDDYDARHILWYTSRRGTLAHEAALAPLADRELWGEEERHAENDLKKLGGKKVEGDRSIDVLYSIVKWQGKVEDRKQFFDEYGVVLPSRRIWELAELEVEQFKQRYGRMITELGHERTVDVERYLFRPDLLVAGQIDLVYETMNGATVAADLKTSGSLREKNKHQIDAYARAVPAEVDRVEVHRIKPSGGAAVHAPRDECATHCHTSRGWRESRAELWVEYQELATQWQREYAEHYRDGEGGGDQDAAGSEA
jgi:hypothetical protein